MAKKRGVKAAVVVGMEPMARPMMPMRGAGMGQPSMAGGMPTAPEAPEAPPAAKVTVVTTDRPVLKRMAKRRKG